MQARSFVSLSLALLLAAASADAEKLKGFYSGSGGLSEDVHRVVMVQFAEDGTVLVQQNWINREPQVWHAHWTQQGKKVTITFDPTKQFPRLAPLVMNIKHGTLVPETWDSAALGPLGPPTLAPFGGKNVLKHSVASCVSLANNDPSLRDCTQWETRVPIN
ncbi:MAG: hypothetical protein JOZ83_15820 [Silvibacterium sp.]|nr:hypothetical protein [Silvibacterium sp.]